MSQRPELRRVASENWGYHMIIDIINYVHALLVYLYIL